MRKDMPEFLGIVERRWVGRSGARLSTFVLGSGGLLLSSRLAFEWMRAMDFGRDSDLEEEEEVVVGEVVVVVAVSGAGEDEPLKVPNFLKLLLSLVSLELSPNAVRCHMSRSIWVVRRSFSSAKIFACSVSMLTGANVSIACVFFRACS